MDWSDDFLAMIRAFVEHLEVLSASVTDSSEFRMKRMLNNWKNIEIRLINMRHADISNYEFIYRMTSEYFDLQNKMHTDYDWVKSQLTISPPPLPPLLKAKQSTTGHSSQEPSLPEFSPEPLALTESVEGLNQQQIRVRESAVAPLPSDPPPSNDEKSTPSLPDAERDALRKRIYDDPEGDTHQPEVARYYRIPRSTLADWLSGRTKSRPLRRAGRRGYVSNQSIINLDRKLDGNEK